MFAVLQMEWDKLKGTRIWVIATLLPLLAVLQGQLFVQLLRARAVEIDPWLLLYTGSLSLFAPLILPVLIALLTALVARVEHQQDTWKQLFALPVRRAQIYAAKLILSAALFAYSLLILSLGLLLAGWLGRAGGAVPWGLLLGRPALIGLAALPILAVQYYLSYRFHSVIIPLVAAVGLTLPALLAANSARLWIYFPWTYPTVIAMTDTVLSTGRLALVLLISALLFAAITAYSLARFSQRDVV